jgi:hypothetical protein
MKINEHQTYLVKYPEKSKLVCFLMYYSIFPLNINHFKRNPKSLYLGTDRYDCREGLSWRDRMIVGFTTTYAISSYHHCCCEFWSRSGGGVQHYLIVCQWFVTGRGFSPSPPVSSTNKTDRHDITEILLKGALNTINQTKPSIK